MARATRKGGIYIDINGNPEPIHEALNGVQRRANSVAGDISRAMQNSLGSNEIKGKVSSVANSFLQIKRAATSLNTDLSKFQSEFKGIGRELGLSAKEAQAFGSAMQRAMKASASQEIVGQLKAIQRQTKMSANEMQALAGKLGVKGVQFPGADGGLMGNSFVKAGMAAAAAAVSVQALRDAFQACMDAMIRMDSLNVSYASIFGSSEAAAMQLDYMREVTGKLGLEFVGAAEGAKGFFAASRGTTLEKDANNIFEAVSMAAQALHLSGEDVQGVFLALSQMVSKGKVSMEELRRQLGDRLPGAFQLAAKAMGMTTAELDKAVSSGNVMADELLPRLAVALKEQYADAAVAASNSVQSAVNRMTSEWEMFKASVLNSEGVVAMLNAVTGALKSFNAASQRRDSREAAVKALEERGVARDENFIDVDVAGQETRVSRYSERLIREEQARQAEAKRLNALIAADYQATVQQAEKVAETSRKADAALQEAYKKTNDGKIDALKQQKIDLQKQFGEIQNATSEQARQYAATLKHLDDEIAKAQKQGESKRLGGGGAVNRQATFGINLDQLRQEVANMQATLDPAAQGAERIAQKLALERDNAIAAAEAHYKLALQRKSGSPEDAAERRMLEIRKAELTYAQKLGEQENKNRDVRVRFYEQLAQLSGNYTETIRLQTEAIREQAREFAGAGIAENIVAQWQKLKELEISRDPFAGMVRGLRQYSTEALDLGKQLEGVVASSFSGMEDAFVKFAQTGKLSFQDLANSIIADLARIAVRATITGPLAQGLGSLFGSFFGGGFSLGGTASVGAGSGGFTANLGASIAGSGFANGGAMYSPSLHSHVNSVVDKPTFFGLGPRITAFARGAGVMGEAGAEAIMPLRRGPGGRLGVEMYGEGKTPQGGNVQVNIVNSTGERVSQQTKTDNYGNKTIDVMIGDAAAAQAAKPGSSMNRMIRGISGAQQQVVRR